MNWDTIILGLIVGISIAMAVREYFRLPPYKKPQPVVDITLTESIIVQKAKSHPDKLTLKEIEALKKIVDRVEKNND